MFQSKTVLWCFLVILFFLSGFFCLFNSLLVLTEGTEFFFMGEELKRLCLSGDSSLRCWYRLMLLTVRLLFIPSSILSAIRFFAIFILWSKVDYISFPWIESSTNSLPVLSVYLPIVLSTRFTSGLFRVVTTLLARGMKKFLIPLNIPPRPRPFWI